MIEPQRDRLPACHTPPLGPPPILVLSGEPQAARAAREFVREFIAYHAPGAPDNHVDSVVLVTSELVTNSIRYGTEPGDSLALILTVTADRVRIEVHDPVRRHPHFKPASEERQRGRGMFIVDALTKWGVDERPFGKIVWAEVSR
ncbi:ATP-binding protein [Streptomyces sp. bgisy100]|uniref:ATP-binding protein n=1 Tax=Streptomyces sp. bgisy100 TaxID=3413783 RepID=UPI003D7303D3